MAISGSVIASQSSHRLPYSDFTTAVDHFVSLADIDGAHDDRDGNVEGRSAAVLDVGSSMHISATGGDALTTAEMIAIHDHYCELEYRRDVQERRSEHGDDAEHHALRRSIKQRRFDALVAIFRSAAQDAAAWQPRWSTSSSMLTRSARS